MSHPFIQAPSVMAADFVSDIRLGHRSESANESENFSYVRAATSLHKSASPPLSGEFFSDVLRLCSAIFRPVRVPVRAVELTGGTPAALFTAADAFQPVCSVVDVPLTDDFTSRRAPSASRLSFPDVLVKPDVQVYQLFKLQLVCFKFDF